MPKKRLKTGFEDFDRAILAPLREGGHPSSRDIITARTGDGARKLGERQDGVIVRKDKDSGIEPGFYSYAMDDAFYKKMNEFLVEALEKPNQDPFREALRKELGDPNQKVQVLVNGKLKTLTKYENVLRLLKGKDPQNNFMFAKFFGHGKCPACEKMLVEKYAKWAKNEEEAGREGPTQIFIKGDFKNGLLVSVGAERTMLTSSMKALARTSKLGAKIAAQFYNLFKMERKKTKNIDFTKETIVNNLAVHYGMQGEIATIKPGVYTDGTPMLLNSQILGKGVKTFEEVLKGGSKKKGSCMAKTVDPRIPLLPGLEKIKYQSDNTIKGVHDSLAFFLVTGDYDMMGSKGSNKGIANGALYAFDFGHSLSGKNPILGKLRDDFRFPQPSKPIKHIDAFYDHTLGDMMQGVYLLMKQRGQTIPKNVLDWYKAKANEKTTEGQPTPESVAADAFLKKLNKIVPGSDVAVFDAFINGFSEAAKRHNPHYKEYVAEVKAMKQLYLKNTEKFLKVFEKRVNLSPEELNLIENIEKLLCETKHIKNTSEDGTVLLNHLRIDFDHRTPCQLQHKGTTVEFTIDVKNKKHFDALEKKMQVFLKVNGIKNIPIRYDAKTNKMVMACPRSNLKALINGFTETEVAAYHNKPIVQSIEYHLGKKEKPKDTLLYLQNLQTLEEHWNNSAKQRTLDISDWRSPTGRKRR